jgi:hypothetical protein
LTKAEEKQEPFSFFPPPKKNGADFPFQAVRRALLSQNYLSISKDKKSFDDRIFEIESLFPGFEASDLSLRAERIGAVGRGRVDGFLDV